MRPPLTTAGLTVAPLLIALSAGSMPPFSTLPMAAQTTPDRKAEGDRSSVPTSQENGGSGCWRMHAGEDGRMRKEVYHS